MYKLCIYQFHTVPSQTSRITAVKVFQFRYLINFSRSNAFFAFCWCREVYFNFVQKFKSKYCMNRNNFGFIISATIPKTSQNWFNFEIPLKREFSLLEYHLFLPFVYIYPVFCAIIVNKTYFIELLQPTVAAPGL